MGLRVEEIKKEFDLKSFGQKGWLSNKNLECPECNRPGKFGIKLGNGSGVVHCFICDYSDSIYKYLKKLGKSNLINNEVEISVTYKLKKLIPEAVEEIKEHKNVKLPHKLKPLIDDPYLNERRFLSQHYKLFEPCYTDSFLEKELHDYIIFKIKQDGELISWLARSRKSYNWHADNLRKAKNNEEKLVLRYRNSEGTEFDKILGGYDDIMEETKLVFLVEGLFDKVGVDNLIKAYNNPYMRCCFTFGNKISDNQIELLRKKKNINTVILLYDYGTIKQCKTYSLKLSKHFKVLVASINEPDLDPGDMNEKQFSKVLENLQNPMEFYVNNLTEMI